MFVRAGATTPLPLEITSVVLFNIGAICFFFWVYFLFGDLVVAAFGTAFLALSKFLLFFPGLTATFPYEFVFFNLTMLFYVLFLKSDSKAYLVAALIAMFMTCMNYWFYYMSSWIILVGLWWQYRGRPGVKEIALLSTPPVAAIACTAGMVMILLGGIRQGAMRLAKTAAARTFDVRIPGGHWYQDQYFMRPHDWLDYPNTVVTRLEWMYSFEFFWFALAAVAALFFLSLHNRRAFVSMMILLAGGLSWYAVMFQHTHIHAFVGQYGFMAICPLFGLMASETLFILHRAWKRLTAAKRGNSVVAELATAALLPVLFGMAVWSFSEDTYGLVRKTVDLSAAAEARYAEAIQAICRQHPKITLEDLKSASRDWGFGWAPHLITETGQTPECPTPATRGRA